MTVRTRFAPSPTGYLHIGGVRTALFNWLLARQSGGQFILRIDDTDKERNVAEALQPILDGFRWLGIDWDEGPDVDGPHAPYFQSQRSEKYQAAVEKLLESGQAYRDFGTSEEFRELREAAEKAKETFIYDRRWMAESDEDIAKFQAEGRESIVRLKMPREGNCEFTDAIRGDQKYAWAQEQDHVIQRADGSFIYHLASVVDDNDYQITHVVRAIEHLPNTPRQIFIAQSLGYELPTFAHIPFVAEPGSQNKLSKRKIDKYFKNRDFKKLYDHAHSIAERVNVDASPETFNPVLVEFYKQIGFQPQAIVNYLLLLGWSLDDKTEEFTREEMIEHFSLDRVVKSPASFDPAKLSAFQTRYFNQLSVDDKLAEVAPFLKQAGILADTTDVDSQNLIKQVLAGAEDRLSIAGDIFDYDYCFHSGTEINYDEKAFEKRLRKPENAAILLNEFKSMLESIDSFDADSIDKALHDFVEQKEIKIGDIIHALRVSVTGKPAGFALFDTMAILGKDTCLERISHTLSLIPNPTT